MPTTLYTNGVMLEMTAAGFESYDAIRHSAANPTGLVWLQVTDGGALDVSAKLGSTSAWVSASLSAGGTIVTGAGDDGLFAGLASSSLFGGAGNDYIVGHDADDLLEGGAGNDVFYGGRGLDRIYGGGGNDLIYDASYMGPGGGDDALYGGSGDDIIGLQSGRADGGSGRDTLWFKGGDLSTIAFTGIEVLAGADFYTPISGTVAQFESFQTIQAKPGDTFSQVSLIVTDGGTLDLASELGGIVANVRASDLGNAIVTGAGDDWVYGGAGADALTGGAGWDVLAGEGGDDALYGGDGIDALSAGDGHDKLSGGAGDDGLGGGAGNDALNGGAGADWMRGDAGHDRYTVDDAGDLADETLWDQSGPTGQDAGGHDQVTASVSFTLGDFVEDLTLTGGAVTGTGNALDNALNGTAGTNTLLGLAGDDRINGGAGDDWLSGGLGADVLTGGAGADVFLFDAGGPDRLKDFAAGTDRLAFDDAAFALGADAGGRLLEAQFRLGAGAGDADDRLIYDQATGRLWFDADGTGSAAQVQVAALSAGTALAASDILIL